MLWVIAPIEKAKEHLKFLDFMKEFKGKKYDEYSEEYKNLLIPKIILTVILLPWMFIGLFTFNWFMFLCFLIFIYALVAPINKMTKKVLWLYSSVHFISSLVGMSFGVFVILNTYHFKIDVWTLFQQWIK